MNFVFVGRLEKLKGTDILLKAWATSECHVDSKLMICGEGPLQEWCKEYVRSHNVKNVIFKGFIPNTKVKEILRNADAMILPTQCYEGFPMTIAEAFSVSTPVIVSDLGNAGSLIVPYVTGLKFEYNSEMALADCIDLFSEINDVDWKKNIKMEYQTNWTKESNYRCLKNIYCAVTEGSRNQNGIEKTA